MECSTAAGEPADALATSDLSVVCAYPRIIQCIYTSES
jgi:hypothetical protein